MAHEIFEHDSMMYVRQKPWHGLGRRVEEAPNAEEAIKLAGLDWEVKQSPVYMDGLNNAKMLVPNMRANYRNITDPMTGEVLFQVPLGIVSDRYKIVQNTEAFDFTNNLLGEGVTFETAGSLQNGKKIWLLARMPETKILGDNVEPYMVFSNSHDGKGAIQIAMTPVRVVCANTLNAALGSAKRSWTTNHVGDIKGKLDEARHCLNMAGSYMDALNEQAEKWAETRLLQEEVEELLKIMFPIKEADTERKKQGMKEMRDQVMACYIAPDILKFKDTAWGAVNAMSDFVGHSEPRRQTKNYQENRWGKIIGGHTIFDQFVKLVNAKVGK